MTLAPYLLVLLVAACTAAVLARRVLRHASPPGVLPKLEEHNRLLIENANDVVVAYDTAGRFTFVNPRWASLTGYSVEEALQMSLADVLYPEDRGRVLDNLQRRLRGEPVPTSYQLRICCRDGRVLWVDANISLVRRGDEVLGVQAFVRDITDRKQAEEALRASEERYRSVVNSVREVIFQTDADGAWTFLNPAWAEMTGFDVPGSIGRPAVEVLHAEDRLSFVVHLRALVQGRAEEWRDELRYVGKDGSVRWMEVLARPVLAQDGAVVGMSGTLTDVTERRRTHEVLATLQAVSTEVAAALDPVRLAELAVRELHERFRYELPSVYFLEPDGKLHMAAQIGYTDPVLEFEPNTGVMGRVAQSLQPALIRDAAADPDFVCAMPGVVAEVCVPIVSDGRLRGMINVEARQPGVLTEDDVMLIELLGQMMAVALRNADLFAAARRRGDELVALQRTSAQVAALRDPDELAEFVVGELRDRFGYTLSSIHVLDEAGHPRVAAYGGYPEALSTSFDPTTGVIGRVLRTGQPELVLEPGRDAEFVHAMPDVCAQVCVPIVADGRVLGVLSAESTTPGQFGPSDLELLGLLGRQMAVALENTRLYRAAQAEWVERARAEAKYRTLFEESKDVLFITTPEGRIIDINPAGVELFGFASREELLRVSALELWANPQDRALFASELEQHGFVKDFPFDLKAKDGRRLAVLQTATVERDAAGRIIAYRGIMRDVTERVARLARERAETARREAILRAARRFAQARDSAVVLRELLAEAVKLVEADDGGIARWDSTRSALVQVASFLPSDRDGTQLGLETTVSGRAATQRVPVLENGYQAEFGSVSPAGLSGAEAVAAVPLLHEGRLVGTLSVSRLRAGAPFVPEELEALELLGSFAAATVVGLEHTQALRQQAEQDALTGLANRQHGTAALEKLLRLAERQNQPVTVAVLDIDHFKSINDLHGHPAGDRVLQRVGELLRSSFRDTDVVARWGGEEFVVGAYGAGAEEALRRTEQLRERLAAELFEGADGTPFAVTVSVGLAISPGHGRTLQALYTAADAALYRAKAAGRNRVVFAAEPGARAA